MAHYKAINYVAGTSPPRLPSRAELEAENDSLRRDLRDAEFTLAAIVRAAGGEVTVSAVDLRVVNTASIVAVRDPVTGSTRYRVVDAANLPAGAGEE